jgi:hypothetical protein
MNSQWHKSLVLHKTPSKLQNPGEFADLRYSFLGVHLKIEIPYFGIKISGFVR